MQELMFLHEKSYMGKVQQPQGKSSIAIFGNSVAVLAKCVFREVEWGELAMIPRIMEIFQIYYFPTIFVLVMAHTGDQELGSLSFFGFWRQSACQANELNSSM